MGLRANYRWLTSLQTQALPSVDHAKKAATKAEMKVAKRLRSSPNVLHVHHALRLTKIEGGRDRREIDLIAVLKDRILLIEVKNFKGNISMDDGGVLHQNGKSRNWTFAKLDDASKRLKDTMQLTGIRLGHTEVHSILLFTGNCVLDDTVSKGGRLSDAHVAKSVDHLMEIIQLPLSESAVLNSEHLQAVESFFNYCGTWDDLTSHNNATLSGDFLSSQLVDEWRDKYQRVGFSNQRGWLKTLLFGPKLVASAKAWGGELSTFDLDIRSKLSMVHDGGTQSTFPIDHLTAISFGYRTFPDWNTIELLKPMKPIKKPSSKGSYAQTTTKDEPPYRIDDIIEGATVSRLHEQHGIFFTLDAKNSGLYRKERMEKTEWDLREGLYRVGSSMPVRVLKVTRKGAKSWNIEVESSV